jgi:hypothetical protein
VIVCLTGLGLGFGFKPRMTRNDRFHLRLGLLCDRTVGIIILKLFQFKKRKKKSVIIYCNFIIYYILDILYLSIMPWDG